MSIEVGVDIGAGQVKVSMTSQGLTSTNTMSPRAARFIADQLILSADNIEKYCDVDEEDTQE